MPKKIFILLGVITLSITLFSVFDIYTLILKKIYPQGYSEYVEIYAEKYEIEKEWIYALIKAESDFKERSVSRSGAIGLMQLMEDTAIEISGEIRDRRNRFEKSKNKHRNWNKIFSEINRLLWTEIMN